MELWLTAEDIRTLLTVDLYPWTGYFLICLFPLFVTEKTIGTTLFFSFQISYLSNLQTVSSIYFSLEISRWVEKADSISCL